MIGPATQCSIYTPLITLAAIVVSSLVSFYFGTKWKRLVKNEFNGGKYY